MRILGVLMFLCGCAGAAYAIWASYHRKRPADVAFAVAAPLAIGLALTGLLLAFVPDFFG